MWNVEFSVFYLNTSRKSSKDLTASSAVREDKPMNVNAGRAFCAGTKQRRKIDFFFIWRHTYSHVKEIPSLCVCAHVWKIHPSIYTLTYTHTHTCLCMYLSTEITTHTRTRMVMEKQDQPHQLSTQPIPAPCLWRSRPSEGNVMANGSLLNTGEFSFAHTVASHGLNCYGKEDSHTWYITRTQVARDYR